MKKEAVILLLLGLLLVSPMALAQEQFQAYSGFNRFIDNVRMFFSFGSKKTMLALEIREKELYSAIANTNDGNNKEAEKNLERAKDRLQYVQKKVSSDISERVRKDIEEKIREINEEENLPDSFETYILEEEKTQLTAELVVEVDENEGQILTRESVEDNETGEERVEIGVMGGVGQAEAMKIEDKIMEIDEQIMEKKAENIVDEGKNQIDSAPRIKDNEDVYPEPNNFVDEVDNTFVGPGGPGPGIVDED